MNPVMAAGQSTCRSVAAHIHTNRPTKRCTGLDPGSSTVDVWLVPRQTAVSLHPAVVGDVRLISGFSGGNTCPALRPYPHPDCLHPPPFYSSFRGKSGLVSRPLRETPHTPVWTQLCGRIQSSDTCRSRRLRVSWSPSRGFPARPATRPRPPPRRRVRPPTRPYPSPAPRRCRRRPSLRLPPRTRARGLAPPGGCPAGDGS